MPTDTSLAPLLTARTRTAAFAMIQDASWDDLYDVIDDLASLAYVYDDLAANALTESAVMVRRLIRIGRRGGDWEGYGPDSVETYVTEQLRWRAGSPALVAVLPVLDAVRALRPE